MKKMWSFNPSNLREQSHFIIMLHHAFSIDKHHVKVNWYWIKQVSCSTIPSLGHNHSDHAIYTVPENEHNGSVRNYKERAVVSGHHLQNHSHNHLCFLSLMFCTHQTPCTHLPAFHICIAQHYWQAETKSDSTVIISKSCRCIACLCVFKSCFCRFLTQICNWQS